MESTKGKKASKKAAHKIEVDRDDGEWTQVGTASVSLK